jgi:hypothetical protein
MRQTIFASLVCTLGLILLCLPSQKVFGQQQLLNQLFQQGRQAVRQELNQRINPLPPRQNQPRVQSAIPGESGRENDRNFGPGDFFTPAPRTSIPPGTIYYRDGVPYRNGVPYNGTINAIQPDSQPAGTLPSRSTSSTNYSEPPRYRPSFNNQKITLKRPKATSGGTAYQLVHAGSNHAFTIRPGQVQQFDEDSLWLVKYNGNSGEKTYRLRGGKTYIFLDDDQGGPQLYDAADYYLEPPSYSRE